MAENKGQGLSRRALLIASAAVGATAVGAVLLGSEREDKRSLKEKIQGFTWEKAQNPKELVKFLEDLGTEYLKLTKTDRVSLDDFKAVNTYTDRNKFLQSVRQVAPDYNPNEEGWGYAHFDTKKTFIDLSALKTLTPKAGHAIADAVWHEVGHHDVTTRHQGELINNPQAGFHSPASNKIEMFRYYRGAEVFTDTYFGYKRLEEVLLETITVRRLVEQVGLPEVASARDYYANGVDFFSKFSSAFLTVDQLYQYRVNSDFEGLAKAIGERLPGNATPLQKGVNLYRGIHDSDSQRIAQTGVLTLPGMRP